MFESLLPRCEIMDELYSSRTNDPQTPITGTCGHTFCRGCLERTFAHKVADRKQPNMVYLTCPGCATKKSFRMDRLKPNILLCQQVQMIERMVASNTTTSTSTTTTTTSTTTLPNHVNVTSLHNKVGTNHCSHEKRASLVVKKPKPSPPVNTHNTKEKGDVDSSFKTPSTELNESFTSSSQSTFSLRRSTRISHQKRARSNNTINDTLPLGTDHDPIFNEEHKDVSLIPMVSPVETKTAPEVTPPRLASLGSILLRRSKRKPKPTKKVRTLLRRQEATASDEKESAKTDREANRISVSIFATPGSPSTESLNVSSIGSNQSHTMRDAGLVWVQCNSCKKYRKIPESDHYDRFWNCEMNRYNSRQNTCEDSEELDDFESEETYRSDAERSGNSGTDVAPQFWGKLEHNHCDKIRDSRLTDPIPVLSLSSTVNNTEDNRQGSLSSVATVAQTYHQKHLPENASKGGPCLYHGTKRTSRSVALAASVSPMTESFSESRINNGNVKKRLETKLVWVQCNKCKKLRKIPERDHYDRFWSCRMNRYDSRRRTCDDSEESSTNESLESFSSESDSDS